MSATAVVKTRTVAGAQRRVVAEFTLDASYPAGGYEIKPAAFGLRVFDGAPVCRLKSLSGSEAVRVGSASYDLPTKKLKVFDYKTQAEIAAASNLAAVVVVVVAWGT